jgi:ubiquinone/menaquinone biosynthesis C-methylase UbiE
MSQYRFVQYDFAHPGPVEILLDRWFKATLGIPIFYGPFVRSMHLRGDETVLDFGCGSGIAALLMARRLHRGGTVTCLDTSTFWLNAARQRLQPLDNVRFHGGDIRHGGVARRSFDAISMIDVLRDIPPRDQQPIAYALAGCLKPGGHLHLWEVTHPAHGMPPAAINRLMATAGLTRLVIRPTPGPTWLTQYSYRAVYRRVE